jgi:hypothetical protein
MALQDINVIRGLGKEQHEIKQVARMVGKYFAVFKDSIEHYNGLYCLVHVPTKFVVCWVAYSATATLFAKTAMKHVPRKGLKSSEQKVAGGAFPKSLREWIRENRSEKHTDVPVYKPQ